MQLDYLKYIVAIHDYGSINKAAEQTYVSQQYISKVLKKTEEKLGKKLFERTSKGLKLTQEGNVLYNYAMEFDKRQKMLDETLTLRYLKDIKGVLRIGAMSTASAMILPQILCTYYHDYPNIKLQITDGDAESILDALLKNKIDLAIILMTQIYQKEYLSLPSECSLDVLSECRLCYWVSSNSPLAEQSEITISQAVKYPVIVPTKSDLKMMEAIYAAYGSKVKVVAECENPYLIHKMVANKFGITPDAAIIDDEWMLKYAFSGKNDVKAVSVKPDKNYFSRLCLISLNSNKKTVLEKHVTNFLLNQNWRV